MALDRFRSFPCELFFVASVDGRESKQKRERERERTRGILLSSTFFK